MEGCKGNRLFKRYAEDQDFIETFREEHYFWFLIWKYSCNCGQSPGLWALWSSIIAVSFGFIFYLIDIIGCPDFELTELNHNLWSMMYYSVVTFTTLGFGDIIPKSNLAASLVMIEVILGYIMLGGLISIFADKIARRS